VWQGINHTACGGRVEWFAGGSPRRPTFGTCGLPNSSDSAKHLVANYRPAGLIRKKDSTIGSNFAPVFTSGAPTRKLKGELNEILSSFPERENLRDVAHEIKQLGAKQMLQEIETRRKKPGNISTCSRLRAFPL